jgi:hypothetical protein
MPDHNISQKMIVEGRLYVAAQQIKIERQRALIKELEIQDGDSQVIRLHKETLRGMMKNLDVVLKQLRLVIDQEGGGTGAFH